jgi:hypothetical protein
LYSLDVHMEQRCCILGGDKVVHDVHFTLVCAAWRTRAFAGADT